MDWHSRDDGMPAVLGEGPTQRKFVLRTSKSKRTLKAPTWSTVLTSEVLRPCGSLGDELAEQQQNASATRRLACALSSSQRRPMGVDGLFTPNPSVQFQSQASSRTPTLPSRPSPKPGKGICRPKSTGDLIGPREWNKCQDTEAIMTGLRCKFRQHADTIDRAEREGLGHQTAQLDLDTDTWHHDLRLHHNSGYRQRDAGLLASLHAVPHDEQQRGWTAPAKGQRREEDERDQTPLGQIKRLRAVFTPDDFSGQPKGVRTGFQPRFSECGATSIRPETVLVLSGNEEDRFDQLIRQRRANVQDNCPFVRSNVPMTSYETTSRLLEQGKPLPPSWDFTTLRLELASGLASAQRPPPRASLASDGNRASMRQSTPDARSSVLVDPLF